MIHNSHEFRTSNSALATFLVTKGYTLLIIEYDETNRGTYVFDNDDPTLPDAIRCLDRQEAVDNIALYEHNRQALLRRIKNQMP